MSGRVSKYFESSQKPLDANVAVPMKQPIKDKTRIGREPDAPACVGAAKRSKRACDRQNAEPVICSSTRGPPIERHARRRSGRATPTSHCSGASRSARKDACDDDDAAGTSSEGSRMATFTPLEQLFLDMKRKHPGVVLLIETGYLFRFFMEDADVAQQELGFNVSLGRRMRTTSIPVCTLHVHIRRLVAKGYKVGVVRMVETALMRDKEDKPDAIYRRELTDLYTKSTLVEEDLTSEEVGSMGRSNTSKHLMCIYDVPMDRAAVRMGILAVSPSSGDIVYDCFLDEHGRQQLECRVVHIRPVEILIPETCLTEGTYRFIEAVTQSCLYNEKIRIERIGDEHFTLDSALNRLREFFCEQCKIDDTSDSLMNAAMELDPPVICCLAAVLSYLREFKLERVLNMINLARRFTLRSDNLHLDVMTTCNLELFHTPTFSPHGEGSLVHVLNKTLTAFGSRLLRTWISQPLRSKTEIDRRLTAVDELLSDHCASLLKNVLKNLPDLESGVMAVFHKKCSTRKYWTLVSNFISIKARLACVKPQWPNTEGSPSFIVSLLGSMVVHLDGIETLIDNLDQEAAWNGQMDRLFRDLTPFPDAAQVVGEMASVETELGSLLPSISTALRVPLCSYTTYNREEVCGDQHPVELDHGRTICCRSPEVHALATRLRMLRDHFKYQCGLAWQQHLEKFKMYHQRCRQVVTNLATLDCLLSLATITKMGDFVRPVISDAAKSFVNIDGGYHVVTHRLLVPGTTYIANDTRLGDSAPPCMIISGANMGGKSCYAKQVAIIALMAQMGSYVPAAAATLTPLDAIYVRSAVHDSIMTGRSSFCVEAGDVAAALRQATAKSLVILDEFGRSTSDSDGSALACGTLQYLVQDVRCLVIAITHFTEVIRLEEKYPDDVKNFYMAVLVQSGMCDGTDAVNHGGDVTFLHRLEAGIDPKGYATNVGRLAGMHGDVLEAASRKAQETESETRINRLALTTFRGLCKGPSNKMSFHIGTLRESGLI